jgi:hypothetical protein
VRIVAAEPRYGELVYGLRNLDEGFVPELYDESLIDSRFSVGPRDAVRRSASCSSSRASSPASRPARSCTPRSAGAKAVKAGRAADIAFVVADGGWKYLSTGAYEGTSTRPRTASRASSGPEFDFLDYDGPVSGGPDHGHATEVVHPVRPTHCVSRPTAASLVYSGDTGICDSLVQAAEDAHVFIAEAAFRDADVNPPDIHLTGREAAMVALKAGVERLVLTHIPAWHDKIIAVDRGLRALARSARPGRQGRRLRGLSPCRR